MNEYQKKELHFKHFELSNKIYKSYEKYDNECSKMTDFLIKNIIAYDEKKINTFYVDYMQRDGIILHVDLNEKYRGKTAYYCSVKGIIDFFLNLSAPKKLTIEEIIEISSI